MKKFKDLLRTSNKEVPNKQANESKPQRQPQLSRDSSPSLNVNKRNLDPEDQGKRLLIMRSS